MPGNNQGVMKPCNFNVAPRGRVGECRGIRGEVFTGYSFNLALIIISRWKLGSGEGLKCRFCGKHPKVDRISRQLPPVPERLTLSLRCIHKVNLRVCVGVMVTRSRVFVTNRLERNAGLASCGQYARDWPEILHRF